MNPTACYACIFDKPSLIWWNVPYVPLEPYPPHQLNIRNRAISFSYHSCRDEVSLFDNFSYFPHCVLIKPTWTIVSIDSWCVKLKHFWTPILFFLSFAGAHYALKHTSYLSLLLYSNSATDPRSLLLTPVIEESKSKSKTVISFTNSMSNYFDWNFEGGKCVIRGTL